MCYPGLLQLGGTMFKTGHAPRSPVHAEARRASGARPLSLSLVGTLVAISMAGMAVVVILALYQQWLWMLTVFIATVGVITIIVRKSLLIRSVFDQK